MFKIVCYFRKTKQMKIQYFLRGTQVYLYFYQFQQTNNIWRFILFVLNKRKSGKNKENPVGQPREM